MKRLLLFVVIAASLATTASAGTQTVSVSPNPVAQGQTFIVAGCGYASDSLLWVRLQYPSGFGAFGFYPRSDAGGCFSFSYSIIDSSLEGAWKVLVNYANRKGSKNSIASTTFLVTP